ncbi:MAG: magnesium/cobalt transporter CorA [Candidatus Lambdaproteobacteria bacterium]|nr:magnesium/cobalt transporter CorA [Candidatus Lambdaproteobacteria bacterium]
MLKDVKKATEKAGLSPGSLVFVGERKTERTRLRVIDYNERELWEEEAKRPEDCARFKDSATVSWIDVEGLEDIAVVEALGGAFGIHPLVLEDILHVHQRPKLEIHDNYLFLVIKVLELEDHAVIVEQVSFVLGERFLLTFQEGPTPVFDAVLARIRTDRGRIRRMRADYLAYALMDAVVDRYLVVLERLSDVMEHLEDELLERPTQATAERLHELTKQLIFMRRAIWPLRDVLNALLRDEHPLIEKSTLPFLRDVYDHTIRVVETVDTLRELLSGLFNHYHSTISNRLNETMKVLTLIATIFIPLTFIVGIYGMNFKHMPELEWHWGYYGVWAVILAVAGVMVVYFRRRQWL